MEEGLPGPPRECYLCGRQQGQRSFAVTDKAGCAELVFAPAELKIGWVNVHTIGDMEYSFPLCQECCVLLRLVGPDQATR